MKEWVWESIGLMEMQKMRSNSLEFNKRNLEDQFRFVIF
jgi:hypothetical protein